MNYVFDLSPIDKKILFVISLFFTYIPVVLLFIFLHEMGHYTMASIFNLNPTLHLAHVTHSVTPESFKLVAFAGPGVNLLLAGVFGSISLLFRNNKWIFWFLIYLVIINLGMGMGNLLPIPGLDGYHLLF